MTAAELRSEMDAAKADLCLCECGSRVVMQYQPGATLIWCLGCKTYVAGVPDWGPKELANSWNKGAKSLAFSASSG